MRAPRVLGQDGLGIQPASEEKMGNGNRIRCRCGDGARRSGMPAGEELAATAMGWVWF